jgi:hypothetical protein
MEKVPRIEICEMGTDAEYMIVDMYNACSQVWLEFLKAHMGYVFESETMHPRTWGFSTWSRKMSP